ncbi:mucin-7 [Ovis aries]|uniref:mucin-7 n=1 Tax=Ovis aries TaxID=9940 RepID=UPI001C2EE116|nr:mucin-7 [Ovis aries]
MKTLPLLVCICALSACFSLSEGHKKQQETQDRQNDLRPYVGSLSYPKLPPNRNPFIQKPYPFDHPRHHKIPNPRRRIFPRPKPSSPPNCPVKHNTVDKNTLEATTQIPSVTPTSISTSTSIPPTMTTLAPKATTTSATANSGTTGSPATSAQPSTTPLRTAAAIPTTSPATSVPLPSSAPEPTAAPNTTPAPSPTTVTPETPKTTAAPTTQTSTSTSAQSTTVEKTTSPSIEKTLLQFFLSINQLREQIWNIIKRY